MADLDSIIANFKIELGLHMDQAKAEAISNTLKGLASNVDNLTNSDEVLSSVFKTLDGQFGDEIRITKELQEHLKTYNDLLGGEFNKSIKQQLLNGRQAYDLKKSEKKLFDDLVKSLKALTLAGHHFTKAQEADNVIVEQAHTIGIQYGNVLSDNIEVIGRAGKKLQLLKGNINIANEGMNLFTDSTSIAGKSINEFSGFIAQVGWEALEYGIRAAVRNFEEFRRVNYRAIGSMRELREATFEALGEFGATERESIDTIKAISHAGIAVDKLSKQFKSTTGAILTDRQALSSLIQTNYKFYQATGASQDAIAQFQKQLLVSNKSEIEQNAILGRITTSMRAYGLTAGDVDGILRKLSDSAGSMRLMFGDTAIVKMTDRMMMLAGVAKDLGFSISAITDELNRIMSNPLDHVLLLGADTFSGDLDKMHEALMDTATNTWGPMFDELKRSAPALIPIYEKQLGMQYTFIEAQRKQRKMLSDTNSEEYKLYMLRKDNVKASEKMHEEFNKAIETISRQWAKVEGPIIRLVMILTGPIADAIAYVLGLIGDVATAFDSFIGQADKLDGTGKAMLSGGFLALLTELTFGFGTLASLFNPITAGIAAIGVAMYTLWDGIKPILSGIGDAIAALKEPMFEMWQELSNTISAIAEPFIFIKNEIVEYLKSHKEVADGLRTFGKLVGMGIITPIITALQAIGVVLRVVQGAFKAVTGIVKVLFGNIDGAKQSFKEAGDALYNAFMYPYELFVKIKKFIFGSSFLHIGEGIMEVISPIKMLSAAFDVVRDTIVSLKEITIKVFDVISSTIVNVAKSMGDTVVKTFSIIADVILAPFRLIDNIIDKAASFAKIVFGGPATIEANIIDYIKMNMAFKEALYWFGVRSKLLVPAPGAVLQQADAVAASQVIRHGPVPIDNEQRNNSRIMAQTIQGISTKLEKDKGVDLRSILQVLTDIKTALTSDVGSSFGNRSNQWK